MRIVCIEKRCMISLNKDFIKVSMRYREVVEKFLRRSLLIHVRFEEAMRNIINGVKESNFTVIDEVQDENSVLNSKRSKLAFSSNSSHKETERNTYFKQDLEVNNHYKKIKEELHLKFQSNIEKILSFFEEKGIVFDDEINNPVKILIQLKGVRDINERNNLIDKLEYNIANLI